MDREGTVIGLDKDQIEEEVDRDRGEYAEEGRESGRYMKVGFCRVRKSESKKRFSTKDFRARRFSAVDVN